MVFLASQPSVAQTILTGLVTDSVGAPVEFANIIAAAADNPKSIISSTLTDDKGFYTLNIKSDCDSLMLKVTSMEISPVTIKTHNVSCVCDIIAHRNPVELNEVIVKAKKIYTKGDTINYNVASFLSQNDQALADVLKRMPGISVSESGQVSYQGKPVKNFYIEGLDLMKSHYGIATNNLDPNDISTVQVLENHQDIKALNGLRPEEQASINIKLKEGVRGVFNLIGNIGGGYGNTMLWNNSLITTHFRRNSQFLATYKGNNTGDDISQELYSNDNDYSRTSNISEIAMPAAPGIDKRFYYFNRSHSATYNNVYRVGTAGEFGINAAYLNDHDDRQNRSHSANTLPDGSQNIVDEVIYGSARTDKAYGDFSYLHNGDRCYLKEQVKFQWISTDADSRIAADNTNISQAGKSDSYRLVNKLHFTRRSSKNGGYEILSTVNYENRPHSLTVSPNLFQEMIDGDMLSQYVDCRNLSTDNRAGFLSALKIGPLALNPGIYLNYHNNALKSALSDKLNNLTLDNLSAGIDAGVSLRTRKLDITLQLPVGYRHYRHKNKLSELTDVKDRIHIEPRFDMSLKIGSRHNLNLKSAMTYSTPTIQNLYSNFILTSYRQLSAYDIAGLFEGLNVQNALSYNYKDILTMSFAGIDLMWNRHKPDVLYGSYYDGLTERIISRRTEESGDMLSATIRGSQGFDWKRLKIGLLSTFSRYSSPLLVQNSVLHYTGSSISIEGDISISPSQWLSMSYNGKYYQSSSQQTGYDRMPWIRTMTNNATVDINLPCGLGLHASIYHYYSNLNDGDKSFSLLNAEARYSMKRLSFSLACDNILNRTTYLYSDRSALSEFSSAYSIRPRSIILKIRYRIL